MKIIKKYYALTADENKKTASLYIFADIVDPQWQEWGCEADVSGFSIAEELKEITADTIHVHINSYGGFVSEGLAIYNTLKQHPAKIITYNDGFCCSAANLPFLAGDERIASDACAFMWHNALTGVRGNAKELRQEADRLEKINQATINAYMNVLNINEDELKALFDAESWVLPSEALEMGFITKIAKEPLTGAPSQEVKHKILQLASKKENEGFVLIRSMIQKLDTMHELLAKKEVQEQEPAKKAYFNFIKPKENLKGE